MMSTVSKNNKETLKKYKMSNFGFRNANCNLNVDVNGYQSEN